VLTSPTMSHAKRLHYSYDEYLQMLEQSSLKLEYCDGVVYAMAGGTVAHAELGASVIRRLGDALRPGCRIFTSDLKVRIEATDLTTFPDASVICGKSQTSDRDAHAVVNPTLLVEVTSRSTEDYDRGDKLSNYKQIGSLRAVLFVSHREQRVTVVERDERGGWTERDVRAGERVTLTDPVVQLDVDAIYDGIALDSE
jgi:Uma2 family endonuclease